MQFFVLVFPSLLSMTPVHLHRPMLKSSEIGDIHVCLCTFSFDLASIPESTDINIRQVFKVVQVISPGSKVGKKYSSSINAFLSCTHAHMHACMHTQYIFVVCFVNLSFCL